MNTLLPRSSFCYRISRTPVEEAENSLTKIISKNELNLHGICIAVIIKPNYSYLYNGLDQERVMATRRGFLFCRVFLFLFVWNLAVHDN